MYVDAECYTYTSLNVAKDAIIDHILLCCR
jgi:hypothetical protein